MLEVERLGQVRRQNLDVEVRKGLAKANAHATTERSETCRVALLSIGCQTHLTLAIESLRDEFVRLLPLTFVHLETIDVSSKRVTLFELIVT